MDQYGAEPSQQQQFETSGVEGVNLCSNYAKLSQLLLTSIVRV